MMKTKTWILIFSLLLALSLAAVGILYLHAPEAAVVQILQDGKLIREIDLTAVSAPRVFTVEDPRGGSNRILVEHGRICVTEADCPDQICVHRGWLPDNPAPIVCIPHRLVIQLRTQADVDALAE